MPGSIVCTAHRSLRGPGKSVLGEVARRSLQVMLLITTSLLLGACSGVETIPADTAGFAATKYTRYAWRSEPLTQKGYSKDKFTQADPAIRLAIRERLTELGYREVANKDDAEFLVEYLAAAGFNDGRLARTASNVTPYPSATINRQVDGASVDNAYALAGLKEMGNLMLVFVDAGSTDVLWRVQISSPIEDANRVDQSAVRDAIRQGLLTLPEASGDS